MHFKDKTSGLFKNFLMTTWLVLVWLCCTAARAVTVGTTTTMRKHIDLGDLPVAAIK